MRLTPITCVLTRLTTISRISECTLSVVVLLIWLCFRFSKKMVQLIESKKDLSCELVASWSVQVGDLDQFLHVNDWNCLSRKSFWHFSLQSCGATPVGLRRSILLRSSCRRTQWVVTQAYVNHVVRLRLLLGIRQARYWTRRFLESKTSSVPAWVQLLARDGKSYRQQHLRNALVPIEAGHHDWMG